MLKPCVCGFGHAHFSGTSQGYGKCMGKLAAEKNERTDHSMDFLCGRAGESCGCLEAEAAEAAVAGKLRQEDA